MPIDYRLYLVTDDSLTGLIERVIAAIEGGVTLVQFRNKTADKKSLYDIGKKLLVETRARHIPLIINDHIDLALALDAEGVHVGQTDLPIIQTRALVGSKKIVGLSIENEAQAIAAIHAPVDYFGVGPVFPTATKTTPGPMGLDAFGKITALLPKPTIAIGGITTENTATLMQHGASGIAVVSGICQASNPTLAAEQYRSCLNTIIAS